MKRVFVFWLENCDLPTEELVAKWQDALADTLPVERGKPIVVSMEEAFE